MDDMEKEKVLNPEKFQSLSQEPDKEDFVVVEFIEKRRSSPTCRVEKIIDDFDNDGNGEIFYLKKSEKVLNKE